MPEYTLMYCFRCKEYKGLTECFVCLSMYCVFCEGYVEKDAKSCDHKNTVVEGTFKV